MNEQLMAWVILIIASILEPCWVICLDKAERQKSLLWGVATAVTVMMCLYLMSLAVAVIGPGVSYAILAGIGSVGIVVAGHYLYHEKITSRRLLFVGLIVVGIIGVRLVSGGIL